MHNHSIKFNFSFQWKGLSSLPYKKNLLYCQFMTLHLYFIVLLNILFYNVTELFSESEGVKWCIFARKRTSFCQFLLGEGPGPPPPPPLHSALTLFELNE